MATLAPAAGGLGAVAYLLWRILNRDQSFNQINEALQAEVRRTSEALLTSQGETKEARLLLVDRSDLLHEAQGRRIAAQTFLRIMTRAAERCTCGEMKHALEYLPRDEDG